jgi:hypothetical protein
MVNDDLFNNKFFLSYSEAKEIIMNFFSINKMNFSLREDKNYGMFFLFRYENKKSEILLSSDRGDLSYRLTFDSNEINLFLFEPLLSNVEWFSKKNILFVLETIQRYLEENDV